MQSSRVVMSQAPRARLARARAIRAYLQQQLGGCCRICRSKYDLEFHYLPGMGREHHRLSFPERMNFYRDAATRGSVELLCADCHARVTTDPWFDLATHFQLPFPQGLV